MLEELCFEILQQCPNNCRFCSSCASYTKTKNIISFKDFAKTVQYFHNREGIKEIAISGGEPLLHPELKEMIGYCHQLGIKTTLFTSGIKKRVPLDITNVAKCYLRLLDTNEFSGVCKSEFVALKEVGLDKVVFDLQAATQDTYNNMMGTHNCFSYVLMSIAQAKFAGLFVDIHYIPMCSNVGEIGEIVEMCNIIGIDQLSILKFVPQGRGYENRTELQLSSAELKVFIENVKKLPIGNTHLRLGIPLEWKGHKCNALYTKLSIRYDGVILPCVAFKDCDTFKVSNVLEKNGVDYKLLTIWDDLSNLKMQKGYNCVQLCNLVHGNN